MSIIPSLAIFGSIAGQLIIGLYLFVQSYFDPIRKYRLLTFSLVFFLLGILDISFSLSQSNSEFKIMPIERYEFLRVCWCGVYIFSILYILNHNIWHSIILGHITIIVGLIVYYYNWQLATSITFPMVYWISSYLHYREYQKNNGYASCVLWIFSLALGISCSIFYFAINKKDPEIIWLGYLHYAILALIMVLNGWVNLPRELRGLSPVKIKQSHANAFCTCIVFFELLFVLSLFKFYSNPPILYIAATVAIIFATLTLQLYHKNQLVIYTGDVTKLLDTKTDSLKKAQIELAKLTEKQAEKIENQKNEITIKNDVIDRQRRLELAAKTAGQVAHDIQNILCPISYQLEKLHEMKRRNNFDSLDQILEKFQQQVNLLLDLNGQLLGLARRGRFEFEDINIFNLVHDIKADFNSFEIMVQSDNHLWVKGSWSQLFRAISNLVKNAIEANNKNIGQVQLICNSIQITSTKKCHLGFLNPGEYVGISVKDYGAGIPVKIIDKIFDPFFSTKSGQKASGSGLGLSIVNALIDDHKGVLDLLTDLSGTTFTIYLPKAKYLPANQLPDLSGNETVMVIDDDNLVTSNLHEILTQNNYRVLIANSGFEAIRNMQAEIIDAVILNFHLPDLNGYGTYYALMHLNPDVKAIMHSNHIFDEDKKKLTQLGVNTFFQKPGNPNEILKLLRNLLN